MSEGEGLLTDDAGNMSTMAIASVIRVAIWNWGVGAIVCIANKVKTVGNLAARTKASTQGGVRIVDAGVDDADADTLSGDTSFVELVYACHDVDGLGTSSASHKGWVVGTTKDEAGLGDGAWNKGDGSDSDDTVGVGQVNEVLFGFEFKGSTKEEWAVIFSSNIHVDAAGDKVFVEISMGLEQGSKGE